MCSSNKLIHQIIYGMFKFLNTLIDVPNSLINTKGRWTPPKQNKNHTQFLFKLKPVSIIVLTVR